MAERDSSGRPRPSSSPSVKTAHLARAVSLHEQSWSAGEQADEEEAVDHPLHVD
jgi:hypothetical protein